MQSTISKIKSSEIAKPILSNAVILEVLSEQIDDKRLLYNLCLVNRQYCKAFRKSLYRHIEVGHNTIDFFHDEKNLQPLIDGKYFLDTKHLHVSRNAPDWDDGLPDEPSVNVSLKIVQNAPNLVSYESCNYTHGAASLQALAKLGHLRDLTIYYENEEVLLGDFDETDIDRSIFGSNTFRRGGMGIRLCPDSAIYLAHFTGLRHLALFRVASAGGNPKAWRLALLNIYLNSPNIKSFAISKGIDPSLLPRQPTGDKRWTHMMDWISDAYFKHTEKPLRLKLLRLDPFFEFPSASAARGHCVIEVQEQLEAELPYDIPLPPPS